MMKQGILIGYFEPLHLGHLQDINTAVGLVDILHIIVMPRQYRVHKDNSFSPTLQDKARAVQVACEFFSFVKVHTADSLGLSVRSFVYDEEVAVFTPTVFDEIVAKLDISHPVVFVQDGIKEHLNDITAVNETNGSVQTWQFEFEKVVLADTGFDSEVIYQNPVAHFNSIAPSACRDYVQTVCIVGGESSGKTTLVHKLANHFGASFALEMGRLYTHSDLGGTEIGLQYSDYPIIANQHLTAIIHAKKHATAPIVIVDTDFVTTQAFCETYEGRSHPVLDVLADTVRMHHTIMLDNNVKWVADGMRSLGSSTARHAFEDKLIEIFNRHHIAFHVIGDDDYHKRYLQAVAYIEKEVLGLT